MCDKLRRCEAANPASGAPVGKSDFSEQKGAMKQTILLSGLCAALLCGCADVRISEYKRPEAPAKSSWSRPSEAAVSAPATISTQWWTEFRDPYLDSLVAKAIAGNFDLKILAARIDVANLQIAEAGAGALPTVDIGAGASLEKSTGQKFSKQFSLGAQVNWDIDVWGKVEQGRPGADRRVPGDRGGLARRLPDAGVQRLDHVLPDPAARRADRPAATRAGQEPADPGHLRDDARQRPRARHAGAAPARGESTG